MRVVAHPGHQIAAGVGRTLNGVAALQGLFQMAARQLQVLLYAGIVNEQLYGVRPPPEEAEIAQVVDEAVATFLARYGSRT